PPIFRVDSLHNYAQIPASLPDGTSNTILYTERYGQCGKGGGVWAADGNIALYMNPIPPGAFYALWADLWTPIIGLTGYPSMFQIQPNPWNSACNYTLPSSGHTSVILTSLGDGSVRTVSQGVSTTTWWLALVPDDGYPMPSYW